MNRKGYAFVVLLLVAAGGYCAEGQSVVAPGAKVEKIAGGFTFTEGPAVDEEGNIHFSDIPNFRCKCSMHLRRLPGLSNFPPRPLLK